MTREEHWRCDACGARIDIEDRGSQWQRIGIAKRAGADESWDLCEACDAELVGAVGTMCETKEKKR